MYAKPTSSPYAGRTPGQPLTEEQIAARREKLQKLREKKRANKQQRTQPESKETEDVQMSGEDEMKKRLYAN